MKKFVNRIPDGVFCYVTGGLLALYAAALNYLHYELWSVIPAVASVAMLGLVLRDTINKQPPTRGA